MIPINVHHRPAAHLAGEDCLRAWLAERLERYRSPDSIEVVDAVPTGSTGKASRALLRKRLMARSASA